MKRMVKSKSMNLQGILNSRRSGSIGLRISRYLPPRLGYRLSDVIADIIASQRQVPIVQAIRANNWVISNGELSTHQLDQLTRETLHHIAHSFFTLFHYIENPDKLDGLVNFSDQALAMIERSKEKRQGLIVAGVHMGNFDLVLQAAAYRGLQALALSLPQPNEAVEWQHKFRQRAGVEILPASLPNFRQAINRLRNGETLLTGIDRPIADAKYRPIFFGRPAHLPVHYINMALKAEVPVIVMASILGSDGIYHILASDLIEMKPDPDRRKEILFNAERILEIAEAFIRQSPHQWTIYSPVWPEVLSKVS